MLQVAAQGGDDSIDNFYCSLLCYKLRLSLIYTILANYFSTTKC